MLIQIWSFLVPGLYKREQKKISKILIISLLLFTLGLLFCFYIVLPYMFQFITESMPKGIQFLPDIVYVIEFITKFLLIFGLFFQIPLLCWVLVTIDLITSKQLREFRPYVIVGAFIIGMLIAPPDVISQTILALPLWFLYEIGIGVSLLFGRIAVA